MNISSIRESSEQFHLLTTTGRTQTATMTLKPGAASGLPRHRAGRRHRPEPAEPLGRMDGF